LVVAVFSNYKDYDTFIDAAEFILKSRKDVCFVAIGGGYNLDKYKNKIKHPRFKFLGSINESLESYINIIDIGVLTSFSEGISNAIMEYMALGKPVIASEGGATDELVIHNSTGFLIEQKNSLQLIEKLLYLINNPNIAKEMGKEGKRIIHTRFLIDNMAQQYNDLYTGMLK